MWDKSKVKEVLKQFSAVAKYLIVALLAVYLFLLAADLLFLKIIYERVYQLVYNTGGVSNAYLINALTMTVTLAAYLVIPMIVWSFITLKKKHFALFLALAYCGGMLGLFILSRPAPNQLFNILTGEPLYRYYRDPDDGRIERFAVDTLKHPRLGVPLEKLTSEVAIEIDKKAKAEKKAKVAQEEFEKKKAVFNILKGVKILRNGRLGPMGVTPEIAARYGVKEEDLWDPKINIDVGTRHLAYLLKKYNQDKELALAAYHAGEEVVDKAIREATNPKHPK